MPSGTTAVIRLIPFPGVLAGWRLRVEGGVGQGRRDYPEDLGASCLRAGAKGVLGIGREGEGVALIEGGLLPSHGDLQLPGQHEDEPTSAGKEEGSSPLRSFARLNLVGADIVEVAPAYDHAQITGIAAAHVGYELLSALAATKATP